MAGPPPPMLGLPAWGGLGSLISDRRAECPPCDGWKDAAWALTPLTLVCGVVVHSLTHSHHIQSYGII